MIWCFILLGGAVTLLQTTVMPYLPVFQWCYDLLVPFVVFVAMTAGVRSGLGLVLALGFVMDSISGAPFGLYLVSYLWLFMGVRALTRYLHAGHAVLLPLLLGGGVLLENIVLFGTLLLIDQAAAYRTGVGMVVAIQVLLAVLTGPVFLVIYGGCSHVWARWIANLASPTSDSGV